MNSLSNRIIFLAIFICNYICFAQFQNPTQYIYNKNNGNDTATADILTKESYITLEMVWEILLLLDKKELTLNRFTGQAQDIVSITELLTEINKKIQKKITPQEKEVLKNGLRTMLEATEIALFVANVQAAHQNPNFLFYQTVDSDLLTKLNNQKQMIEVMIKIVNNIQIGEQSSYFSWLWTPSQPQTEQYIPSSITVKINEKSDFVTIPAQLIATLIKNNDYKQSTDPVHAANLLFKECFIAQQHHLKDANRINQIRINLTNPISANNYIYTNFPNFYEICQIAKDLIPNDQYRASLEFKRSQEQLQAHELLMHTRQAVQTALYIANRKSSFNLGYLLPNAVKSYLDATLNELLKYDAEVSTLCKDPRYGATVQDTYQDEQWANITKWAIGAVVTTAVIGAAATVATPYATPFVKTGLDSINSWWNNGNQPNKSQVKTLSDLTTPENKEKYNYLIAGSAEKYPALAAALADNNRPTNSTEKSKSTTWYDYVPSLTTLGNTGKIVAFTGGIANQVGAQMQKQGDPVGKTVQEYGNYANIAGSITGGLTGKYADVGASLGATTRVIDPQGKIGAVGGAIGASLSTIGAVEQAYKTGQTFDSLQAANAAANAYSSIYNAYEAVNNPKQPINNVNIKILTPQEIYNGFINIIQRTIAESGNLFEMLHGFISYLFTNRMATPPLIADMLQKLPKELTANQQVAQPVNQMIQILNDISQQPAAAA